MENAFNQIEPLLEKFEEYGKSSAELYKLKFIQKTTEIISGFISRGVAFVLLSMFFVFASIGLAFWLGDVLDKTYLGFLLVAGFYLVLGVITFYFVHKYLKRNINNTIIMKTFSK